VFAVSIGISKLFPYIEQLSLHTHHWQDMLEHVLDCLPEEACGILGGRESRVELVIPVTNDLHSPVRFRMAPEEQLRAFKAIEDQQLDLIAFFHSHPNGPSDPSETDLAEFAYPGVLSIIWSVGVQGWRARAFRLDDRIVQEVPVIIQ
jgi:[CysO sulfur-carrier protein]-S-L-cysteine hydrolase